MAKLVRYQENRNDAPIHVTAAKTLEVGGVFGLNESRPSGDFRFIYKAPASDLFRLDYVSHGQTMTGLNNGKFFTKRSGGNSFAMNVLDAPTR